MRRDILTAENIRCRILISFVEFRGNMAPFDTTVRYQFKGIQGTEMCYTNIFYASDTDQPALSPLEAANAAVSQIWTPLKDLLSAKFTMLSVTAFVYVESIGFVQSYVKAINEAGLVSGDVLPPNVTVRANKYPENDSIVPGSADPFEVGRLAWSGIPEANQDDGLLLDFNFTDWQLFFSGIFQIGIDYGSGTLNVNMGMFRRTPGVDGTTKVYLSALNAMQNLGTQNTRKRR